MAVLLRQYFKPQQDPQAFPQRMPHGLCSVACAHTEGRTIIHMRYFRNWLPADAAEGSIFNYFRSDSFTMDVS